MIPTTAVLEAVMVILTGSTIRAVPITPSTVVLGKTRSICIKRNYSKIFQFSRLYWTLLYVEVTVMFSNKVQIGLAVEL